MTQQFYRIMAFKNTQKYFSNYQSQKAIQYFDAITEIPYDTSSIQQIQTNNGDTGVLSASSIPPEEKVAVVPFDSFSAAYYMNDIDPDTPITVLNMASDWKPGGGVITGSLSQEEDLCRRSNLYDTIKDCQYPFPTPYTVLWSPKVKIAFDESNHPVPRDDHLNVSVVSVAGIRKPSLPLSDENKTLLKDKITAMLKVCKKHNPGGNLVLGALGCGVFANPPNEVALAFKTVLNSPEFKGVFKHIIFAILKRGQRDNNFDIFRSVFP